MNESVFAIAGIILGAIFGVIAYFLKKLHDSHEHVCETAENLNQRVSVIEGTTQKAANCKCSELANQIAVLEGNVNKGFVTREELRRAEDLGMRRHEGLQQMVHDSFLQINSAFQALRTEFIQSLAELRKSIMDLHNDKNG